jgi:hypothetical protein
MSDDPLLYVLKPDGTVDSFFRCAIGAEPTGWPSGFTTTRTKPTASSSDPRAEALAIATAALKAIGMSDDAIAALFLAIS